MNLKRRLETLERKNRTVDNPTLDAIAHLVGCVDGLFWPTRYTATEAHKNAPIAEVRRRYHKSGLLWSGPDKGGDDRAWKQAERLRRSLETNGLIELTKTKSTPLVRPTFDAEQMIRRRLGLKWILSPESIAVAQRLIEAQDRDDEHTRHGGWLSESALFDSNYDERPKAGDWFRSIDCVMPWIARGYVEATQSTVGHVFYRWVQTGDDSTAQEPPKAAVDRLSDLMNATNETDLIDSEAYLRGWNQQLDALDQLPASSEIFIQLSASK